jgi:hypothetical protein
VSVRWSSGALGPSRPAVVFGKPVRGCRNGAADLGEVHPTTVEPAGHWRPRPWSTCAGPPAGRRRRGDLASWFRFPAAGRLQTATGSNAGGRSRSRPVRSDRLWAAPVARGRAGRTKDQCVTWRSAPPSSSAVTRGGTCPMRSDQRLRRASVRWCRAVLPGSRSESLVRGNALGRVFAPRRMLRRL